MGVRSWYYVLTGTNREREVTRRGIRYRLTYGDNHGRALLKRGVWEPEQTAYFCAQVRARGIQIFIDVGSCFGYYSVYLVKHAGVKRAFAIEAQPDNFKRLQRHIALNRMEEQVTPLNVAVSEHAGELPFLANRADHPGASRIVAAKQHDQDDEVGEPIIVQAKPLDQLFCLEGEHLALKMDIEGHEYEALRGASQLLQNNRVFIQVETFPDNRDKVHSLLEGMGYRHLHRIYDDHYFANY